LVGLEILLFTSPSASLAVVTAASADSLACVMVSCAFDNSAISSVAAENDASRFLTA
jgi:hypothetical protein